MTERYRHIDELIRKAEEILDRAGTPSGDGNRYASKVSSETSLFLRKEAYQDGNVLLIWANHERVLLLGKTLEVLVSPPRWQGLLDEFYAEVMAQPEVDAVSSQSFLDMDELPGMRETGDFMGGQEMRQ